MSGLGVSARQGCASWGMLLPVVPNHERICCFASCSYVEATAQLPGVLYIDPVTDVNSLNVVHRMRGGGGGLVASYFMQILHAYAVLPAVPWWKRPHSCQDCAI